MISREYSQLINSSNIIKKRLTYTKANSTVFHMSKIQIGAYIVPQFTDGGTPITPGKFVGNEQKVQQLKSLYEEHALSVPGSEAFVPSNPVGKVGKVIKSKPATVVKTKKAKKLEPAGYALPVQYTNEVETGDESSTIIPFTESTSVRTKKNVFISNEFGQTKVKVLAVLNGNDAAIGLVFDSEEDISFIPKTNQELTIMFDDVESTVYYSGIIFDWIDNRSKLMLFIRTYSENESETVND